MGSYEAEWLALTSYTKWVFLRLHCGTAPVPTYVTYSTFETQSDNSRPFRALLGMMLAIATETAVPSNASTQGPLQVIPEDEEDPENEGAPGNGECGPSDSEQQDPSYEGKQSEETNGEQRQTRSMIKQSHSASLSTSIRIAWSEEVTPGARWLTFRAVDTDGFPGLGNIKLRLQRSIGRGSTGIVYEAIPEEDDYRESSKRQRYAIKAVTKGETEEERSALQRLRNELRIYREIEQRQSKRLEELSQPPGLVPDLQGQSEMS
ncbi:uncharacterized protein FOMMEDRAFT_144169, partial [Fomitiporia mediterranea MF3/22]|uniref:uncharacterized protein n=1 Tax=Fomitiporia mediterranea (strain MF3/22) TaxID=694068 RepID=UPI00044093C3